MEVRVGTARLQGQRDLVPERPARLECRRILETPHPHRRLEEDVEEVEKLVVSPEGEQVVAHRARAAVRAPTEAIVCLAFGCPTNETTDRGCTPRCR